MRDIPSLQLSAGPSLENLIEIRFVGVLHSKGPRQVGSP